MVRKKGEFWSLSLPDETISHSIALTLMKNILKYCLPSVAQDPETAPLSGGCVDASSLLQVSGAYQHHWFCPRDHWLLSPGDPEMGSAHSDDPGLALPGSFLPFASRLGMFFLLHQLFPRPVWLFPLIFKCYRYFLYGTPFLTIPV